ncbi:MAG: hypothetical protein BRC23_02650 [Parcubacteria group bacterium SW_4_49_11]|nr:MAG: hypothetical protein BRC23_02650 [Parcubacteria group bacterium SW_4_49_11]
MLQKGPLTYLFGHNKLKLLKFFFYNPERSVSFRELARRTKISQKKLEEELKEAKKHEVVLETRDEETFYYALNRDIPVFESLESIIFELGEPFFNEMAQKVERVGDVKAVILQGVFVERPEDRIDMCLIGDDLDKKKLTAFVRTVEAEIGTELKYTVMATDEFTYRREMFDRFVWNLIENGQKRVLFDKVGIHDDKKA